MEVEIEYANTCCSHEQNSIIASASNQMLNSGYDKFYLSRYTGRRNYAMDYFNWTIAEFYSLPTALRYMIYDIGKSGSSGTADSVDFDNPKYEASTAKNLCSETVSWYYYQYNVRVSDTVTGNTYDFRDVTSHEQIHDAFKNSGRLYCYHIGRDQWILRDRNYNWVYSGTYQPQAGDYLDRRPSDPSVGDDGHAMMLIEWNDATNEAIAIDGPYNISFRPINIRNAELNGTDFCVGKIPAND